MRYVAGYNNNVIKSFAQKGLKEFYERGSKNGLGKIRCPYGIRKLLLFCRR